MMNNVYRKISTIGTIISYSLTTISTLMFAILFGANNDNYFNYFVSFAIFGSIAFIVSIGIVLTYSFLNLFLFYKKTIFKIIALIFVVLKLIPTYLLMFIHLYSYREMLLSALIILAVFLFLSSVFEFLHVLNSGNEIDNFGSNKIFVLIHSIVILFLTIIIISSIFSHKSDISSFIVQEGGLKYSILFLGSSIITVLLPLALSKKIVVLPILIISIIKLIPFVIYLQVDFYAYQSMMHNPTLIVFFYFSISFVVISTIIEIVTSLKFLFSLNIDHE